MRREAMVGRASVRKMQRRVHGRQTSHETIIRSRSLDAGPAHWALASLLESEMDGDTTPVLFICFPLSEPGPLSRA
jgi:hypothetical protein